MDKARVYSDTGPAENWRAPDHTDRADGNSLERTVLSPGIVLFPVNDMAGLRARWREIQIEFLDDPRRAVEQANALVGLAIQQLTDVFANEHAQIENLWAGGKDVSTEDLRQALCRYRSFLDRLLSL